MISCVMHIHLGAGRRVAHHLGGFTQDYFELDAGYAVATLQAPKYIQERRIDPVQIKARTGVTILAVRTVDGFTPYTGQILTANDVILVGGPQNVVDRLH